MSRPQALGHIAMFTATLFCKPFSKPSAPPLVSRSCWSPSPQLPVWLFTVLPLSLWGFSFHAPPRLHSLLSSWTPAPSILHPQMRSPVHLGPRLSHVCIPATSGRLWTAIGPPVGSSLSSTAGRALLCETLHSFQNLPCYSATPGLWATA